MHSLSLSLSLSRLIDRSVPLYRSPTISPLLSHPPLSPPPPVTIIIATVEADIHFLKSYSNRVGFVLVIAKPDLLRTNISVSILMGILFLLCKSLIRSVFLSLWNIL